MIRSDYFLRQLDLFARALRKILGWRQNAPEKAHAEITRACRELVGLDAALLEALAPADIIRLLSTGGEPDLAKCAIASGLLEQRALLREDAGEAEAARELRLRALELAAHAAEKGGAGLEGVKPRLAALVAALGAGSLPPGLLDRVRPFL